MLRDDARSVLACNKCILSHNQNLSEVYHDALLLQSVPNNRIHRNNRATLNVRQSLEIKQDVEVSNLREVNVEDGEGR